MPYMGHAGAGFPPLMPYGAEMMQPSGYDNYGRPNMPMGYGHGDSFPPYAGNFGPSTTPHSFHDSQSSAAQDEGNMYGQFAPPPRAGHGDDMHAHGHQGRMFGQLDYSRAGPGQAAPPPHIASRSEDYGDGIVAFLQQQFGVAELADVTLELRYRDDRAPPVRVPGHRLLFARSESLAAKMREQYQLVGSDQGPGAQTLLLETDSKWLRSDAFYMAVQRLYGLPLLPVPPVNHPEGGDMTNAGSGSDQCDFALSYAAAGDLLCWSPVLRRGCQVATRLLGWQTMEKILEFALHCFTDTGSHEQFAFGEGSLIVLNAIVTFIVHNLPESFQLDTTTDAQTGYARLPECPPPPPAVKASTTPAPAGARGSSVQFGKGRRSQQITGIQFGDLSLSEEVSGVESETPKATRQAQPVPHTVLSRVLLNLPFAQLKAVLESSGSGNVSSWANAEARYRTVKSAVEEREARRMRTLDAILRGRIANTDHIRSLLRSPTPQNLGPWSAVGWQEEILPYGNPDGPSLGRKWVPFAEPPKGPGAEYP